MSLCGTNNEQLKIELLSLWKLEAEFRNFKAYKAFFMAQKRGKREPKLALI